jgi:hypothetical protein
VPRFAQYEPHYDPKTKIFREVIAHTLKSVAAIPFRQIAELILVVQGEEPVRGWAHRGVSTPTHQCARFSKVGIINKLSRVGGIRSDDPRTHAAVV